MSAEEEPIKTFANGKPEPGGAGKGPKPVFSFRPSALSSVAESMWKKSGFVEKTGGDSSESRSVFGGFNTKSSAQKRTFSEEKKQDDENTNDSVESNLSSSSGNLNEKAAKRPALEEKIEKKGKN